MSPRRSPSILPSAPSPPSGATSEVRVLSAPPSSLPEPDDEALAWLDAHLAQDLSVDESAIDLLAVADDESARPIREDELTPPRPSRVPSTFPPSR